MSLTCSRAGNAVVMTQRRRCYYNSKEYSRLTPGQKKQLCRLHDERGGKCPAKHGNKGNDTLELQIKKKDQTIAALTASVENMLTTKDSGNDSANDGENGGNGNHTALTRQEKERTDMYQLWPCHHMLWQA